MIKLSESIDSSEIAIFGAGNPENDPDILWGTANLLIQ